MHEHDRWNGFPAPARLRDRSAKRYAIIDRYLHSAMLHVQRSRRMKHDDTGGQNQSDDQGDRFHGYSALMCGT